MRRALCFLTASAFFPRIRKKAQSEASLQQMHAMSWRQTSTGNPQTHVGGVGPAAAASPVVLLPAAAASAASAAASVAVAPSAPLLPVDLEVARTPAQRQRLPDAALDKQLRMWLQLPSRPRLHHGLLELPVSLVGLALSVRCDLDGALQEQEQFSGPSSEAVAYASVDGIDPLTADLHISIYILSDEEEEGELRTSHLSTSHARAAQSGLVS
jgi:hypothetical protein